MLLFTFILSLVVGQLWQTSCHSNPLFHNGHYYPQDFPVSFRELEGVELILEGVQQSFDFGVQGWATQYFYFNTTTSVEFLTLFLWDCFCPGDGFFLYLDGQYLGETITDNQYAQFECAFYIGDPELCLSIRFHDYYENTMLQLEPGYHEILIRVRESYWDGGVGFISAYPVAQK